MKPSASFAAVAVLSGAVGFGTHAVVDDAPAHPAPTVSLESCFSPRGDCTAELVRFIASAKKSVHVLAYSFTSAPIADALVDAHVRGREVEIVLDRGQPNAIGSQIHKVVAAGIPTWVDRVHAIAHNKTVIIDAGTPQAAFETGSFNFTASAEDKNSENMLFASGPGAAVSVGQYELDFQLHKAHSVPAK